MTPAPRRQAIEAAAKAIYERAEGRLWSGAADYTRLPWLLTAEKAIDAYEAALWRPIGEAPADGDFLVLAPGHVHGDIQACRSRQRQDAKPYRVIGGQFGFDLVRNPTHFHPLPAPPQDPETKP
jgi:hypothetical protein